MRSIVLFFVAALFIACGGGQHAANSGSSTSGAQNQPKDGNYAGTDKVTKIDNKIGSVELDHKDIPGLMPAMTMEFYVADRSLLTGLSVGDEVNFTVLYDAGTEKITKISHR